MVLPLSICFKCQSSKDCHTSTQGSICHDCWTKLAWAEPASGTKPIAILPEDPLMKGFVIVEGPAYITLGGTLYFFLRREDAERQLSSLRTAEPMPDARVEEAPAYQPFLYVMKSSVLKLLVVKEIKEIKEKT